MRVEISGAPTSKKVFVHDPTLPRSARISSKSTIVVTSRERVKFEKLRIGDQYDYEMNVDAVGVWPPTWRHAGLPPDGTFTPEPRYNIDDPLRNLYSDKDGFAILVMAACNLVMSNLALSDNDRKPAEVKASLKPAKPLPPNESLTDFVRTENRQSWDELDEECMIYTLGMLVRLFYRGDGETGDRDWREQELRKAVIMYMSGTGGTSQFTNFTSLCMAMELAAGFAKSVGIRPDDEAHKGAAGLLNDAIQSNGTTNTAPESDLAKVCSKVLGKGIVERVEEYPELNNRLKHYGSDKDAEYFNNNVNYIQRLMRRLRADAAYFIMLGLMKLYGTENPPTLPSKFSRASQVILSMIEDCLGRHGAKHVDGSVESKIRWFADFIEQDAIKSEKAGYDNKRLVLGTLETLVTAAGMLDTPDGLAGVRALARELKDAVQGDLKPSEYGLDIEHDEELLCAWLEDVTHSIVVWMDGQFHHMYVRLHVARHGRTSRVKCDPGIF